MRHFLNQHKALVVVGSAIILLGTAFYNIWLFMAGPDSVNTVDQAYIPLTDKNGTPLPTPALAGNSVMAFPWVIVGITAGVVVVGIIALFIIITMQDKQKRLRDQQRKNDLLQLASAMEGYYKQHGYYPKSTTYKDGYYAGVNLSKDWTYYNLPPLDEMKTFLASWPLSDPNIKLESKDQQGNYVYYVRDGGQRFDLYAHLELPGNEAVDYNRQDNLPQALGLYNYKVTSQVHGSQKTSTGIRQPGIPGTADSLVDQSEIEKINSLLAQTGNLPESRNQIPDARASTEAPGVK